MPGRPVRGRARLFTSEREVRTLLEFLADASRAVAATLDPLGVLSTLGRLAVPRLADWSAAYLPTDGALRRCAVTVREHQDLADRLVGRFPVALAGDTPVARAFRRGTTEAVPEVTPDMVAVETTTVAIDESIEVLAGEAVGLAADGDRQQACELLMSRCLRDRSRTDDCCVVLVRMPGTVAAALPADALGASTTTAASPARPPGGHRPPRRRRRAPRRPKAPGAPGAAGGTP